MSRSVRGRKSDRIDARLSTEAKRLIALAAESQGLSLSDFVVRSAQEAAEKVLRDRRVIELSTRDSVVFVEAMDNPPTPNEELRAAMKDHLRDYRFSE
jgi:uncharacterized protein (DUF1778 family)